MDCACIVEGEQCRYECFARGRVRDYASAVGSHVDFEEYVWSHSGETVNGFDGGDLSWVIDHEREAVGS